MQNATQPSFVLARMQTKDARRPFAEHPKSTCGGWGEGDIRKVKYVEIWGQEVSISTFSHYLNKIKTEKKVHSRKTKNPTAKVVQNKSEKRGCTYFFYLNH